MQILGIDFFEGSVEEAVNQMWKGGLVVAPSGPGLAEDFVQSRVYRQSLLTAKVAIADSGAMVLVWNAFHGKRAGRTLKRLSGLAFLRAVFEDERIRTKKSFWIMPSASEAEANVAWLATQGIHLTKDDFYLAPDYRTRMAGTGEVEDPDLLTAIESARPELVVINVGGGIQEPLGAWLSANLSFQPAILCTGAAVAFLTGRQAAIPPWADRFYLGWLLRIFRDPARFGSRYLRALPLLYSVARYGAKLPPERYSR